MEEETPTLQPSELYNKRKSKDAARLKAYNKILEQIYNRIRVSSRLPNSQCYLLYTVPPFILGLPKIDMEDCVIYLIYQLRQSGFETRYTYPNLIYISWLHHEKDYLTQQSPILQAMMESAEKAAKEKEKSNLFTFKKQKKVKFGGVSAAPSQSGGSSGLYNSNTKKAISHILSAGPPPPSASEYIPPTSFLKNVENPSSSGKYNINSLPDYFNR